MLMKTVICFAGHPDAVAHCKENYSFFSSSFQRLSWCWRTLINYRVYLCVHCKVLGRLSYTAIRCTSSPHLFNIYIFYDHACMFCIAMCVCLYCVHIINLRCQVYETKPKPLRPKQLVPICHSIILLYNIGIWFVAAHSMNHKNHGRALNIFIKYLK